MPRGSIGRSMTFAAVLLLACLIALSGSARSEKDSKPASASDCSGKDSGDQMASRIQQRYDGIRDLRARFQQINESATFGGTPLMTADIKRGRVIFAKPGRMRWSYEEPERSEVVSDGETLWIYDQAARSASRFEVTAGFLSGAALQFLLGDGKILESFEVEVVDCDQGQVKLHLIPRREATYERLGLVAGRDSGQIVETSVLDVFGNLTRIRFEQIEVNLDPDPKTFDLELPEDVEVLDYEAPTSR